MKETRSRPAAIRWSLLAAGLFTVAASAGEYWPHMSVGWFRPEAGQRLVCIHSRLCPAVMLKTDGASLTAFADGQNVLPSSHGHNDSGKTALRVRAVAVTDAHFLGKPQRWLRWARAG